MLEPIHNLARYIPEHLESVDFKHVVHENALSNYNGNIELMAGATGNLGWNTVEINMCKVGDTIDVPVKRLDDIDVGKVGYLKVDVEGHGT